MLVNKRWWIVMKP